MTDQPRPAQTMREIRERLGHVQPGIPAPTVLPTAYVVSCLPEGHDDRYTYTINVQYRGDDRYAVRHGMSYANGEGAWSYEPGRGSEDDELDDAAELDWIAAHRFELSDALRLARRLAPTLAVRGRTVADVLAEGAQR